MQLNAASSSLATLAGGAFAAGLVLTFVTRQVARRVGFVAKPRAERWHRKPTALAGGVGIFGAFAVTSLVIGGPLRFQVLAGATAMFALGLIDDMVQLRPYTKLLGQVTIAAATVLGGAVLPWTSLPIVDQAISLFWIVGITNALNLLDNMDGLAGGVACVGATFQAVFFVLQHQLPEAACAAALAGALLGFLVFNWNPASIFMGDCGALFLGYTLATLALHGNYGRSRGLLSTLAVPVLVMLVPVFDTTFVTVVRMVRGRPVSQGGRDHTSHRLVTLGLSERTAVTLLIAVGALGGATAVLGRMSVMIGVWVGAPLIVLALAFVGIHLARTDRPVQAPDRANLLTSLAAFGYRRRIFEVVLDAVLAMIALVSAFLLRFDGEVPAPVLSGLSRLFLVVVVAKLAALYFTHAYDGVWRYVSARDVIRLMRGAGLGSVAAFLIAGLWLHFENISRGALIIDGILYAGLLASSRLSFKLLREFLTNRQRLTGSAPGTRVLLWGAGDLGYTLARRLLDHEDAELVPVGFVDDDPTKRGRFIHGLPVHGDSSRIARLLEAGAASLVLVTSARISPERIAAISEQIGTGRVRRVRESIEDAVTDPPRVVIDPQHVGTPHFATGDP